MLSGLLLTAFLMGVGGIPHCAAMCGAGCAAAFPRGLPLSTWLGRLLGYALLGAVAAVSAGAISGWGRDVAMLKPLWVMAQVAVVMLGVYLLVWGRMPARLESAGRGLHASARSRLRVWADGLPPPWGARLSLAWPFFGGVAWALLPCGLLYGAVMVAALAPHAFGGAAVMLAFATASSVGVWAAPWVFRRLSGRGIRSGPTTLVGLGAPGAVPVVWLSRDAQVPLAGTATPPTQGDGGLEATSPPTPTVGAWGDPRWSVRLSGLCLAAMSVWAVWHQLVAQWQAWCA